MAFSLPMSALGRNQAMKHMVRANVVIDSVRQASDEFQDASSSGFQDWSHSPPRRAGSVVVMRGSPRGSVRWTGKRGRSRGPAPPPGR